MKQGTNVLTLEVKTCTQTRADVQIVFQQKTNANIEVHGYVDVTIRTIEVSLLINVEQLLRTSKLPVRW